MAFARCGSAPRQSRPASSAGGPRPRSAAAARRSLSGAGAGGEQRSKSGGERVSFARHPTIVFAPERWRPPADAAELWAAPAEQLRRTHVYGINGSLRSGVHFVRGGRCIYAAAKLCIVEDLLVPKQDFFEGHNEEVTCLGYNGHADLAISGQRDPPGSGAPFACVWCPSAPSRTLAELRYVSTVVAPAAARIGTQVGEGIPASRRHTAGQCVEEEFPLRSIAAVAIARHARNACMAGCDDAFTITIFELPDRLAARGPAAGKLVLRPVLAVPGGKVALDSMTAHPADEVGRFRFVGVTTGGFRLWDFDGASKACPCTVGTYGKNPAATATCFSFAADGTTGVLSGKNNRLYFVNGTYCASSLQVASPLGAVTSVGGLSGLSFAAAAADGSVVLGGLATDAAGRQRMQVFAQFSLADLPGTGDELRLPSGMRPRWNSIDVNEAGLALLSGENHCLVLVDLGIGAGSKRAVLRVLQVGHAGEAFALAHSPTAEGLCASGDSRGVVFFWDLLARRPLAWKALRVDCPVRSLAFGAAGDLLAAGLDDGFLGVFEFPSLASVARLKLSQKADDKGKCERVALVVFSEQRLATDTAYLACGCWDQSIYLLKVGWEKQGKELVRTVTRHRVLKGNSSSPTSVMFTADAQHLMSTSKDGQILVWKVSSGERVVNLALVRDSPWPQWTCVLGWPVLGVWRPEYDLTDINAVSQSRPDGPGGAGLIAVGDDLARVLLYRFPAPCAGATGHMYEGHAAHVSNVAFGRGNILTSLGGDDHALMQWTVVRGDEVGGAGSAAAGRGGMDPAAAMRAFGGVEARVAPAAPPAVPPVAVPAGAPFAGYGFDCPPSAGGASAGGAVASAAEQARAVLDCLGSAAVEVGGQPPPRGGAPPRPGSAGRPPLAVGAAMPGASAREPAEEADACSLAGAANARVARDVLLGARSRSASAAGRAPSGRGAANDDGVPESTIGPSPSEAAAQRAAAAARVGDAGMGASAGARPAGLPSAPGGAVQAARGGGSELTAAAARCRRLSRGRRP
eukprot:TRINITY_DN11798_c0_g2_i2.p1 TRINITY_DN11798_c0_g2~~TRINITY_DN11798_c0_g2_i2.p1  ORF type:complete len:1028 (-),score=249.33 TRINITY_DN11798_c0_g2_i2:41-3124(-)